MRGEGGSFNPLGSGAKVAVGVVSRVRQVEARVGPFDERLAAGLE